MVEMIKEKYKDFLYIEVMPDESKNATFYENMDLKLWQTECQCRFATSMVKIKGTALLSLYYM